ncbi:Cerberus [Dissostichus eleginoides]|uniref:Cerberus n=1 Tax=Dissostichus eleginoides TaxID=100907 RepID=A0AAD9BSB4_DISEL|nr:Cerberus [Dissostichus eleginoides]
MAFSISLVFLSSWTAVALTFPHNAFDNIIKGSRVEFESSGSGLSEPVRGIVRVVQLDPRTLAQSGFLRAGLTSRRVPSLNSRLSFPAFLSHGRPGLAPASKTSMSPLHLLQPKGHTQMELKKRQGLQMWQRAVHKGDKITLPRVTADECDTVTVHNRLCFGQCSSLFVPSVGEFSGLGTATGALHHRAPCSRCSPSKVHNVAVPLRCGAQVRLKQVMVVEECKCETGREEKSAEASALAHL